jgi:hypothetical protein
MHPCPRAVKPPTDETPESRPSDRRGPSYGLPARSEWLTDLEKLESQAALLAARIRPTAANRRWMRPSLLRLIDTLDATRRGLTAELDRIAPERHPLAVGGAE